MPKALQAGSTGAGPAPAQSQGALPAAALERLEGGGGKGVSGAWSFLERGSVFTLQTLRTRSQKVRGFAEGERMEGGIPRAGEDRGEPRARGTVREGSRGVQATCRDLAPGTPEGQGEP